MLILRQLLVTSLSPDAHYGVLMTPASIHADILSVILRAYRNIRCQHQADFILLALVVVYS